MTDDWNRDVAREKARDHYQRAEQSLEKAISLPNVSPSDPLRSQQYLQLAQTHALLSICNLLSVGFSR